MSAIATHLYKLSLAIVIVGVVLRIYFWTSAPPSDAIILNPPPPPTTVEIIRRLPGLVFGRIIICIPYFALGAAAWVMRRRAIASVLLFAGSVGATMYCCRFDYWHYIHLNKESFFDTLEIFYIQLPVTVLFALVIVMTDASFRSDSSGMS